MELPRLARLFLANAASEALALARGTRVRNSETPIVGINWRDHRVWAPYEQLAARALTQPPLHGRHSQSL